ncbi:MAG: hypothetical protein WC679_11705 [Bacteroidales bacterium]|jgi:hypothetical protein
MNEYFFSDEKDVFYLDSAEVYLDDVIENCEYKDMVILHKLQLLSYQRNYKKALNIIDSNKWDIDTITTPYFISVLKKRFEAMQLLFNNDTLAYNNTIKSIVSELDNFLIPHKQEVDSVLRLSQEEMIKSPLWFPILQYYYYKFILFSPKEVKKELDVLEKSGVNKDVIDWFLTPKEDDKFLNYEVF